MTANPCACGCGEPVTFFRTAFRRFVRGHQWRSYTGTSDYKHASTGNGLVDREHRVRAERALGKPLPPSAVVHHVDGTRSPQSQLVICEDKAYHEFLHLRIRIARAGGNPNTEHVCGTCGVVKLRSLFQRAARTLSGVRGQCKACGADAARRRRARLKAA